VRCRSILPSLILAIFAVLFSLAPIVNSQSPDSTLKISKIQKKKSPRVDYFYVHGVAALGFDVYNSSDINSLFEDLKINTVGFPFQYGIRGGFRHIAQFEYHLSSSSAHNIGTVTGYVNGQWTGKSVPMKLKATDILFKLNPIFWSWSNPASGKAAKCLFVIVGTGNVTYKDKIKEGFEGSGMIYGLEWAGIAKYASFSIGMTLQKITYDKGRLFGTNFSTDLKASRFIMYTSFGLGYGI
jgi:hypothetical protein